MPKTKLQEILFGLMMSVSMAYGMEVYNIALKEGGLSQMTNRYSGTPCWKQAICGFLYSCFPACGATGRPQTGRSDLPPGGQPIYPHGMDLQLHGPCDVPHHERRGSHLIFRSYGPRKLDAAARLLGWNRAEEFPHGSALESLCCRSHHPAAVSPHIHAPAGKRITVPPRSPQTKRKALIP